MTDNAIIAQLTESEQYKADRVVRRGVFRRLLSHPTAVLSMVLLILLVILAVFSPVIFGSSTAIDVVNLNAAPNAIHPFGTDELGRDMLARVTHGGELSLGLGIGAVVISLIVGAAWGLGAASSGGWIDEVLMRTADAAMTIPAILFAMLAVTAFGASWLTLVIIIGLAMAPSCARIMRAAVLSELKTDYVRGLIAVGARRIRILWLEVLPNALPVLLAQATLNAAAAIMIEASLSFIGLGIRPPNASWGSLLYSGYNEMLTAPWCVVFPAIFVVVAVASLNVLGKNVQRVLFRNSE